MKHSREMKPEGIIISSIINFLITLIIYAGPMRYLFLQQAVPKAFIAFLITIFVYWFIELLPIKNVNDDLIVVFGSLICFGAMLGRWLGSAWLVALWAGCSIASVLIIIVMCNLIDSQLWMGSVLWCHSKWDSIINARKIRAEKAELIKKEKAVLKQKEAEMNFNREIDL